MSTEDHPDWWRPIGGQNSQDSILERRSLIWNDNEVETPDAPPNFYTCQTYAGKFFPRGCRGMIEEIQIYCRDAGQDLLTLRYSPHPCLGPFGEVTITPLAGWSWVGAVIEEMWDYDSLFIWVYECEPGTDWGYDTALPYDLHYSLDTGATWSEAAQRPFIRVVYTGETPGDVPISGIVNNIPIPNVSSKWVYENIAVPQGPLTNILQIEGCGYLDLVVCRVAAAVSSEFTYFIFYADGVECWRGDANDMNTLGFNDDTQPLALPAFGANAACTLLITKRWEFRRRFWIFAQNALGPQTVTVMAYPNLLV